MCPMFPFHGRGFPQTFREDSVTGVCEILTGCWSAELTGLRYSYEEAGPSWTLVPPKEAASANPRARALLPRSAIIGGNR
jgi:hypothetical protein